MTPPALGTPVISRGASVRRTENTGKCQQQDFRMRGGKNRFCCSHAFSVFPFHSLLCSGICSRVRERHPVHTLNVTNGNRRGSYIDHLPLSGSCCRVPGPCGTAGFPLHPHPRGCFLPGALQRTGRHLLLAHPGLLIPGGLAHLFHPSCWEAGRQREPAPGVGTVLCL